MNTHYDIHLSAESIKPETIQRFEALGFVKDWFQNNRNSKPPHYHASYREHFDTPNDSLWNMAIKVLTNDPSFRGCLEEESFDNNARYRFDTRDKVGSYSSDIRPFVLTTCRPGEHKTCDIHINVDLAVTSAQALDEMEKFNFISFERKVNGSMRRIYSLTFEDVERGEQVFNKLAGTFVNMHSLVSKMKLEKVTRFMVHPNDAEQLPIVRNEDVARWIA